MVQLIEQGLKCAFKVGEVHDPTGPLAHFAGDVNLDPEGMAVHAGAFVVGWNVRQAMSRLDLEDAKDIHGRIVPPGDGLFNRRS